MHVQTAFCTMQVLFSLIGLVCSVVLVNKLHEALNAEQMGWKTSPEAKTFEETSSHAISQMVAQFVAAVILGSCFVMCARSLLQGRGNHNGLTCCACLEGCCSVLYLLEGVSFVVAFIGLMELQNAISDPAAYCENAKNNFITSQANNSGFPQVSTPPLPPQAVMEAQASQVAPGDNKAACMEVVESLQAPLMIAAAILCMGAIFAICTACLCCAGAKFACDTQQDLAESDSDDDEDLLDNSYY